MPDRQQRGQVAAAVASKRLMSEMIMGEGLDTYMSTGVVAKEAWHTLYQYVTLRVTYHALAGHILQLQ